MWKRKNKNIPDERIMKESNALGAKIYYVMMVLTVVSLVVKFVCKVPFMVYSLELLSLLASGIYVIVAELKKGILLVRDKDEALLMIHREILAKAMMIMFWIFVFGEFLFLFVAGKYFFWIVSFLAIWFVPALVYTIAAIKNGWLIWGTKKRETEGKKNFKVRVVIGSLFFGIFTGFPFLFKDGVFQPEGILWILGMGASWGIMFYVMFMGMMKVAEKRADKNVEEKEKCVEE